MRVTSDEDSSVFLTVTSSMKLGALGSVSFFYFLDLVEAYSLFDWLDARERCVYLWVAS